MAQSRLEKVGSVYSRMSSLLQSGAVKIKPLWFDVYEAFPPKYEPRCDRFLPIEKPNWEREVIYEEDAIRAMFYKHFQDSLQETMNLLNPEAKSLSQAFIEAYKSTPEDIGEKARFLAAVDKIELEKGINLRQKTQEAVVEDIGPEKSRQISMKELFLQNQAKQSKDD
uniref:Small ribosomal subunit protein mS23 n=1 Tax=Caligus clemensi TaxID=344056 RepID=C1C0M6_CALCM|nr:Mitochondrial ribosomal protein S23 [Caligus clemensi]